MSTVPDRSTSGRRRSRPRLATIAFWCVIVLIVVFTLAPLVVVAASSVTSSGYLTFPPQGFSLQWYAKAASNTSFTDAFSTSLQLAVATTAISVVGGLLAAYGITRSGGRAAAVLEQVFLSPLLLPGVVLGLGLLFVLSASGWRGYFLGGLLAHIVVASPFAVRSCLAGLRGLDQRVVEASRSLGAGEVATFLRVVVPSVLPSIASGAVFAFVISFDEAVVTLFLTGSHFHTLPVTIFTYVQYSNDPTIAAVATVLVVFCALLVGISSKLTGGKGER